MIINIIIDNKIRIPSKVFGKKELKHLKKTFTYTNPQYYKLKNMGYNTKGTDQFVTSYEVDSMGNICISRGGIYKLRKTLIELGYKFKIIDNRLKREYSGEFLDMIEPFQYQVKPIEMGKKYQNCIIHGECGSGKTEMALKIACDLKQWTLIIVPTGELLTQWIERIKSKIENWKDILGQWGNGSKNLMPITVAIINSANNDAEYLSDKFGTIIVDEAHRAPSSMFAKVIDKSRAYYRIAFTATPYRKDGLQCLMYDQFGKIVAQITEKDLQDANRRTPVDVIMIPTGFKFNGVTTEIEDENGNVKEKFRDDYNMMLEMMTQSKVRNKIIFDHLIKNINGYNLILTDRVEFAHNWKKWLAKKGIEAGLMLGGSNMKEESSDTKRRMNNGELHVAIGTTVADEGLDIPRLEYIYCTTPTANNKRRIRQQRGRAARVFDGKTEAKLYYFLDVKVPGFLTQMKNLINYLSESKVLIEWKNELMEANIFVKKFNDGEISI